MSINGNSGVSNNPFKKRGLDHFGFLTRIKHEICGGGISKLIGEQRSIHCGFVIDNFHLVSRIKTNDEIIKSVGDKEHLERVDMLQHRSEDALLALFNLLSPEEKKIAESPQKYFTALHRLRYELSHLSIREKEIVSYSVYLHDIGYSRGNTWDHGLIGAGMLKSFFQKLGIPTGENDIVPGTVKNPVAYGQRRSVLFNSVQYLVANHGLLCNFGADIFPENVYMVRQTDPRLLRMLFILDCLDCTGKVSKGPDGKLTNRNMLTIRLLAEMQDVLDREGLFLQDKEWFYNYRLEHLLGPNTFVHVNEKEKWMLEAQLAIVFNDKELDFFRVLLTEHLEDRAFPIFQELFINHRSLNATVSLLHAITKRCMQLDLKNNDKVLFMTEPDVVFDLQWKSPQREKAILDLKTAFLERKFNEETDLVTDEHQGKKRLILKLKT